MKQSKKIKKNDIVSQAVERFKIGADFYESVYRQGDADRSFAYGEQWEPRVKAEREKEGRPCLKENRLLPFIHQVVNEIRQQRPKIRPVPVNDGDIEVADILKSIIRKIEIQSDAESAYDTAAKNAVEAGLGYIRIRTDYESYDSFEQDIFIDRVINPESVILDPNHKRLDAADMEWAIITEDMPVDDFNEMYPDAEVSNFDTDMINQGWYNSQQKTIRVAEYFYKSYEKKTLLKLTDGTVIYKGDYEVPEQYVTASRTTDVCKVKWAKITGLEVLEETELLGAYIPLVPVVGEEVWLNGRREFHSLIRQARDPQYMLNIWKSASTEIIGLQPKASFVGAVGQFKTYAEQWSQANIRNYPFLQYDPVVDQNGMTLPAPQRQAPPTSSGSMMQEAMASAEAIKATLGMYDASAGEQTDDVSGKAIIARQLKGDNATFHFVDNLVTAMKQVGRILVELIPLVYVDQRLIKVVEEDGSEKVLPINMGFVREGKNYRPAMQGESPEGVMRLDVGKYSVDIDVGASYTTKRQEQANAILEMSRANPEILNIAGDLFVKSLDVPLAQEIADRIRSTMDPALLGDDPEAEKVKALGEAVKQLQAQLEEANSALLVKTNNEQFKNQLELGKLELERKRVELDTLVAMSDMKNKEMEVKAEAFKDFAQGVNDLGGKVGMIETALQDVQLAVNEILDNRMESGVPESPEQEPENGAKEES